MKIYLHAVFTLLVLVVYYYRFGYEDTLAQIMLFCGAAGIICNVLVVSLNGGRMPSSIGGSRNHCKITRDTKLRWLSDIISLPPTKWHSLGYMSIGDVLLYLAIVLSLWKMMGILWRVVALSTGLNQDHILA
ncbi:MAG: DUF5317 family protein [bacterium]|nr:DUF5317 family protein [bacterium]